MPADSPPSFDTLSLQCDGITARLALNRPQRLNALAPQSMHEIIAAAQWLAAQPALRVALLSGNGRAFCAGFDLQTMRQPRGTLERADTDLGRRMIDAWLAIPAITLAAVHSHCVGGGLLLAAACDLRIAADDARFVLPEMALGIPLTWGGVPLLVRLLGPAVAMEMVLDAEAFDAATALRWRFANRCVAPSQLQQASQDWADRLARRPLQALRATKRRFQAVTDALCTSRGSEADADDLLAAYRDPETRAAQQRYMAAQQR